MRVILAYSNGEPVCAHASSYLGEMGEGILTGSTQKGLELNASYLVWWRTLLAAHQSGMKFYNLGGIDPEENPSVHQFKMRMGGKEIYHIGTFDATKSLWTKKMWESIETVYRIMARQ
jgi:lipid II:glycine glycyltransferase (peptidoglycan interpeptide bridge formation enzyme)